MAQPKTRLIKNIVLLVHPFYSLGTRYDTPTQQTVKNYSFLAGVWGKELLKAQKDPKTFVVIVWPKNIESARLEAADLHENHEKGFGTYVRLLNQFERFKKFAQNQFTSSKRLLEFDGLFTHDTAKLIETLRSRGYGFDPKMLRGRSFGEYWYDRCVQAETIGVSHAFQTELDKIKEKPFLSLAPAGNRNYENNKSAQYPLGSIRNNLRQKALKLRRKLKPKPKPRRRLMR